ncbi:hypothetical protein D3C73_666190 [compost metagenome]
MLQDNSPIVIKVVSLTESNSGFKKAGLRLKNFSFIVLRLIICEIYIEDVAFYLKIPIR